MAQSPEALTKVLGSQSSVVSLLLQARAVAIESLAGDIRGIAIDPFDRRLRQYLIMSMGSLSDERLRILFLDGARHLIADEVVQSGSLAQLPHFAQHLLLSDQVGAIQLVVGGLDGLHRALRFADGGKEVARGLMALGDGLFSAAQNACAL